MQKLIALTAAMLFSSAPSAYGSSTAGNTAFRDARVIETLPAILAPRDRVEPENRLLRERLDTLLPALMAETEIDLWLVLAREYAEDPVFLTLVPQPTFAARRTTMLVFHRTEDGRVERLSINRYPFGEPYESTWSGGDLDAQWKALAELIVQRDPKRIGINVSQEWPVADGLTHGLHQRLMAALPEALHPRVVSAERLAVRWLETRSEGELTVYPQVVALARAVIAEAFSSQVITPGVTHTDDVAWYLRQRFEALGLPIWFMPSVNLQRNDDACTADTPICGVSGIIQPGDVLHTDVGICYLKLCTDTQEMAYVLRFGEDRPPQGLLEALAAGNRWQDALTSQFATGLTGNEVLSRTHAAAERLGLVSSTYTHPLGFFGHAPGPTIGMWDNQGPTPGQGDWPLHPNTAYAIEGNVRVRVPEWGGREVQIKLEQDAVFDGTSVRYLAGRQTTWHVIR